MMKNIQKFTNSLNKKVDTLAARLERSNSNVNPSSQTMPVAPDEQYAAPPGYYYPQQPQQQYPLPYSHGQPPPPPPGPPPTSAQQYYATQPQQHGYTPSSSVSQRPCNAQLPPQLPLPQALKQATDHHLPMAHAGYPDAAVVVSTGTPILPPQSNTPSPSTVISASSYEQQNKDLSMLAPPPQHADMSEKHAFIIRISTIATVAVCGDLGVQPWFCSLQRHDNGRGGGISEEYHIDEMSLLRANFGSIGLPVGTSAQLVNEFTRRNISIFDGYNCEIRGGRPAVLIERFANYDQMLDVYYRQAVDFANTALQCAGNNGTRDVNRVAAPVSMVSLKFPSVKQGSNFQNVVDTVRGVKRVS